VPTEQCGHDIRIEDRAAAGHRHQRSDKGCHVQHVILEPDPFTVTR
jgi:hypothetical protein